MLLSRAGNVAICICIAATFFAARIAGAAAVNDGTTVCASVGRLQSTHGAALAFGRHLLPPMWSVRREVRFQLCDADGRSLNKQEALAVVIEPLANAMSSAVAVSHGVLTDTRGRFTGVYGAANRAEGAAWPQGVTSSELHHFRIGGRTIATFLLEREAGDVRFTAWKPASNTGGAE